MTVSRWRWRCGRIVSSTSARWMSSWPSGMRLRRFLWVQGGDGVWRRRKVVEQEIVDEVAQRNGLGVLKNGLMKY